MKRVLSAILTLVLILSPIVAAADHKWIRVENKRVEFPIWYIYITPAGQRTWGDDQLGGEVISAGYSKTWTIPWDGCYVDLRAVTFSGLSTERFKVNICGGGVWSIYDQ